MDTLLEPREFFAHLKITTSEEWIENLLVGPLHNVKKRLQTLEKQRSSESDAAVWDEIPVLIETCDQVFDLYFKILWKGVTGIGTENVMFYVGYNLLAIWSHSLYIHKILANF